MAEEADEGKGTEIIGYMRSWSDAGDDVTSRSGDLCSWLACESSLPILGNNFN
jgi:hypothetical protein